MYSVFKYLKEAKSVGNVLAITCNVLLILIDSKVRHWRNGENFHFPLQFWRVFSFVV